MTPLRPSRKLQLTSRSLPQFLYHTWITDPKAALRGRGRAKRKFWRKYTKGVRPRRSKKDGRWSKRANKRQEAATLHHSRAFPAAGHVAIEVGEVSDGQDGGDEDRKSSPGNPNIGGFVLLPLLIQGTCTCTF